MGVASTVNTVVYTGNGTSTNFSYPYYYFKSTDLLVYVYDTLLGGIILKTLGTDFTITATANAQGIFPSGGTVIFTTAPLATDIVMIDRTPAQTQNFAILQNGTISSTALVQQLDYMTLLVQSLQDQISRCVKLPAGSGETFATSLPSTTALTPLGVVQVNSSADGFILSTTSGGSGTVTAVSVASANGFAGSSSGGATPAITLSTSITGVIKGNGTAISAAAATDIPTVMTTSGDIVYGGASGVATRLPKGSDTQVLTLASGLPTWATASGGGGSGTVYTVSVATANGFAGTVANATTTPAITLTTSVTGVLKGNGTAIAAATSGTDYAPGTSGNTTGIVKSTTSTGALTTAIAADFPTLNQNTTGTASNVTGTVAVANGGTGLGTLTSGNVILGAGTSNVTFVAPGTSGNVLKSNGSTWVSGTATAASVAPTVQLFTSAGTRAGTVFQGSSGTASATAGATYTNNGNTFTLLTTVSSGTYFFFSGTGAPSSGTTTLTKASGTGDSTIAVLSSAALAIYTTPTSPSTPAYLKVIVSGAGGGGGGGGTSGGSAGGPGAPSAFGTSLLIAGGGGAGDLQNNAISAGGLGVINAGASGIVKVQGGAGFGGSIVAGTSFSSIGGAGGANPLGGSGAPQSGTGGNAGGTNTGAGGAGGGSLSASQNIGGNGGSAGGYVEALISSPGGTYFYAVGAGGGGGATGSAGSAGGPGAAGFVSVTEYY